MSNSIIRWGILGTSHISGVMAKAIHESDNCKLIAIGSRSISNAKIFAEQYSIQKYYDDYNELLKDPEIDAIYLGLPNHLHKEWMIKSALASKHILCEKPFVVSINEAHEVKSTIEKTHVFCTEGLMYRFHPLITKLQEIIQNKIIGDIQLYSATYSANIAAIANPTAGGSIRNLGCYPISLIRLLANAEPIETCSMGRVNRENNTDNQASILLKFADHSIAVVSTADDIDMFWQFDIYGTKGNLKVITNPWMPSADENIIHIYNNNKLTPTVINITASKSLYTYQIDYVNSTILNQDITKQNKISLSHSLGNTIVLEQWLQQVKNKELQYA